MASPHVAGVAALLAAKGLTNSQILECLRTTSSNGGSFDPVMGYGIVDADNATKTCSHETTPDFAGAGGGAAGGTIASAPPSYFKVTARHTKSRRRIRVTIKSTRAVQVKLRALARKRGIGRKMVRLRKAGTKRVLVRVKKHRHVKLRVRWAAAGRKGVVRVR
jgi:hypothetical protein